MDKTPWTWGRFKAAIESAGVKDDDQIAWIDWSAPADFVNVQRYSDGALKIVTGYYYEEMSDGK